MYLIDKSRPPLIIDFDAGFLSAIDADPYSALTPPRLACSGSDAQMKLSDLSQQYSGIFINPKIANPSGLSVIRCAHAHRAGTPIFLLCDPDEKAPLNDSDLRSLGVHQLVRKPIRYSELVSLVSPLITMFDAEKALAIARRNTDPVSVELSADDANFTPILAENFLSGRKSFFDVYVRIKNGRYVKILMAGDAFSGDRLLRYINKGVLHFYLRKEAQESYLNYCSQLSNALVHSKQAPIEVKTAQVLNFGEETLRYLLDHGLQEPHIKFAAQYANSAIQLVDKIKATDYDFVKEFLGNHTSYSHGAATTMIAALLLHPMQVQSDRLRNLIGVASLFHDIGLSKSAPHLEHENEMRMSMNDLLLYQAHPETGARLLSEVKGIDLVTIQAVAQHHSRRDGRGFPDKTPTGQNISRVAEIIGIADEFLQLLTRAKADPKFNPFEEMEKKVFNGFSYPVITAFRTAFMPRDATTPWRPV